MKIRAAFVAAVLAASILGAAETGIEFAGVLTAGGKTRIALTDKEKKTTTWVEAGDLFNGFTVARYDPKEDAVYLTKGGAETRLALITAKAPELAPSPVNNAASAQVTSAIRSNLRQLATAARLVQTQRGVSTVNYNDLVGPDKPIKELKPVAGENYSTLSFGQNVVGVSVTTANGTTVALDLPAASIAGSTTESIATQTAPAAQPEVAPAVGAGAEILSPTGVTNPVAAAYPSQPANVPATPTPSTPTGLNSSAGPTATGSAVAPATAPTVSIQPQPVDPTSTAGPVQPTGRQAVSPSYMIQGGDTWERISVGTGVPVQQLKQLNPSILEGSALPAGQTIRVR